MSVRLMETNSQWEQEFEQAKSMLLYATEGWLVEVQHIGSTAVAEVVAQPTIDMLAGMEDLRGLNEAAGLVEGLNYLRLAAPHWCEDEFVALLQKPRLGEPTHTVLITKLGGKAWQRALAIRDELRANLLERQSLDTCKRDNFGAGCQATADYAAAKNRYFAALESRIAGGA